MARDNDRHAVVTPLLGAGVLGTGAYGSYKLDKHMTDLGIRSGLTLNKDAIRAINEFANATPEQMSDPSRFIFRYADLGNKASKAQLFNEDPRKAYEWYGDKTLRKGLSKDLRTLDRGMDKLRTNLADFSKNHVSKIIGKKRALQLKDFLANTALLDLHNRIGNFQRAFKDTGAKIRLRRLAEKKIYAAMADAHETEIGKSQTRALIRLMSEWADVSKTDARGLVRDTADAIYNASKYINPETGKPFRNATEYLAYRYTGGSEKAMRPYMKLFSDLEGGNYSSKKEVVDLVKKRLFPTTFIGDESLKTIKLRGGKRGRNPFQKELLKNLGKTTKYEYDPLADKLVQAERFRRRPGVTDAGSIRSIIRKSPALTFMATELGQGYRGKEFGQMIKGLRIGQALRNPKLRLALGIGSAGLGGLGITNLVRNIRNKE